MLLHRGQYQQFKMVAQTGEQSFGVDCSRLLEFQLCFDQEQNRWCFKKRKKKNRRGKHQGRHGFFDFFSDQFRGIKSRSGSTQHYGSCTVRILQTTQRRHRTAGVGQSVSGMAQSGAIQGTTDGCDESWPGAAVQPGLVSVADGWVKVNMGG